jgi:hypothetical protein
MSGREQIYAALIVGFHANNSDSTESIGVRQAKKTPD